LFVEFGEIVSAKVVTDRNTKKSLGYGFVKFLCEDDAKLAIQRLNGFTIDNKCLKVSVARPASLEIRNCKLYVTNLPKDYTEIDVIHLFQEVSSDKVATFLFLIVKNVALSLSLAVRRHNRMPRSQGQKFPNQQGSCVCPI